MARKQTLLDTMRNQGHKVTRQRRLVLDILESTQEHLDAETLYVLARERDSKIGLATVYRTLALLKGAGLVEQHQLGENHGHFETVRAEPHYHFQCLDCGYVTEFQLPPTVEHFFGQFEQEGMQVLNIRLNISGRCAACARSDSVIDE